MYCLPGSQHEGHELHRQEHDGVRGSGGGDHRHPPHHAVQRQEGRQLLHPAQGNNGFETRLGFFIMKFLLYLINYKKIKLIPRPGLKGFVKFGKKLMSQFKFYLFLNYDNLLSELLQPYQPEGSGG